MKIKLALAANTQSEVELLSSLIKLPYLGSIGVQGALKHEFDAKGKELSELADLSNIVQKAFGQRCLGAHPVMDRGVFVVTLSTSLRSVSGGLKIKSEDYKRLEAALLAVVKKHPDAYARYKKEGLSDMRYNWDVFRASGFPMTSLYHYLNDEHINSALAKILKNSGKSSKAGG